MIYYSSYLLALAPLAFALPQASPTPQTQSNPAPWNTETGFDTVLDPAIQKLWYRDFNATAAGKASPSPQYISPKHVNSPEAWTPAIDDWLSWSKMWELNEPYIKKSSGSSLPDSALLKKAFENHSFKSKVDARLILALFLNEAVGNVAIECNPYNPVDCGMFQIRGGRNYTTAGATPEEKINNMILDGLYGNLQKVGEANGTPGYQAILNGKQDIFWGEPSRRQIWAGNPFGAARYYNSGDASDYDLTVTGGSGDKEYVNKFASRLVGWQDSWAGN